MTPGDVALWIWLAPFILLVGASLAVMGGMLAVVVYRAVQRWRARGPWARRQAVRQWWSRNWTGIAVYAVIFGWFIGGFLVVVWLNGGA